MYRVFIFGALDAFAKKINGKSFNRRGLIRFFSRHVNKLVDYEDVAVAHGDGPECSVNFFFVGRRHMSDRIPTHRIFHP